MLNTITLKEHPELLRIVRKVSPKYRKHKAFLSEASSITNHGSYWDGGSRKSVWLVNSQGFVSAVPGPTAPSQFGGGGSITTPLPRGSYAVEVGVFRGKTATATITKGIG